MPTPFEELEVEAVLASPLAQLCLAGSPASLINLLRKSPDDLTPAESRKVLMMLEQSAMMYASFDDYIQTLPTPLRGVPRPPPIGLATLPGQQLPAEFDTKERRMHDAMHWHVLEGSQHLASNQHRLDQDLRMCKEYSLQIESLTILNAISLHFTRKKRHFTVDKYSSSIEDQMKLLEDLHARNAGLHEQVIICLVRSALLDGTKHPETYTCPLCAHIRKTITASNRASRSGAARGSASASSSGATRT